MDQGQAQSVLLQETPNEETEVQGSRSSRFTATLSPSASPVPKTTPVMWEALKKG